MRYLYICVDFSAAMLTQEYSPSRVQATMTMVQRFAHKYFEQNPLSQLGIIMIRDKKAEKLCSFTSESSLSCCHWL
jgi:transcription initiation factor TFIIH subunit 2